MSTYYQGQTIYHEANGEGEILHWWQDPEMGEMVQVLWHRSGIIADATVGSLEEEIKAGRASIGKILIVDSGRSPFDYFMRQYETPQTD